MSRWVILVGLGLMGTMALADDPAPVPAPAPAPAEDVLQLRWGDVKPIKQVKPRHPAFAKIPLPARCKIRFTIDTQGVPEQVVISECHEKLKANAEKAAMKWRFEPVKKGGLAKKAAFTAVFLIRR